MKLGRQQSLEKILIIWFENWTILHDVEKRKNFLHCNQPSARSRMNILLCFLVTALGRFMGGGGGRWIQGKGETKKVGQKISPIPFAHHESHINSPGAEFEPQRWAAAGIWPHGPSRLLHRAILSAALITSVTRIPLLSQIIQLNLSETNCWCTYSTLSMMTLPDDL
jgi:hypothetical protein